MIDFRQITNNLPKLERNLNNLVQSHLDVGFLDADQMLKEDVLINELGNPILNIPGTHFFSTGVEASLPKVRSIMKTGAEDVLNERSPVDKVLDKVGIAVEKSIIEVGEDKNVPSHILNHLEHEVYND